MLEPIPTHPADADVDANMREAGRMSPNPFAFRDAVEGGGRWDYKKRAGHYENERHLSPHWLTIDSGDISGSRDITHGVGPDH
jgi:hypothetical protein